MCEGVVFFSNLRGVIIEGRKSKIEKNTTRGECDGVRRETRGARADHFLNLGKGFRTWVG